MPSGSPRKRTGRHSDPSTYSLSTTRKSPLRVSAGSRASRRLSSPRKTQKKQPLHIRMNLTETQMDRITDAFTDKVNSSPTRSRPRVVVTPKTSPRRNRSTVGRHNPTRSLESNVWMSTEMTSPTFSEVMPGNLSREDPAKLAERRQKMPPSPIRVGPVHSTQTGPRRVGMEPVPDLVSPLSQMHLTSPKTTSDDYSYYSPGKHHHFSQEPLPLRLGDRIDDQGHGQSHVDHPHCSDEDQYQKPSIPSESPPFHASPTQRPRRSKSTGEELRRNEAPALPPFTAQVARHQVEQAQDSPVFSPLALYFRADDFPTVKKGEKTMIGQNGWLERTEASSAEDKEKRPPAKKTGIIDSIKKIAKDMSELHYGHRRTQSNSKDSGPTQLAISLNPREQSLIYCELEFHLTNTLNDFIIKELDRGHLDADKLKKIADSWQQQGRVRVVGFRYDLETQLELINLHIGEFTFYGRRQGNPVEISGLLHAMKVNARAMRVRTFCQPDSVMAKQLVDSQSLFNLTGASNMQQIALAEVAQFFKVIVEREMDHKQRQSRDDTETVRFSEHESQRRSPQHDTYGQYRASERTSTERRSPRKSVHRETVGKRGH